MSDGSSAHILILAPGRSPGVFLDRALSYTRRHYQVPDAIHVVGGARTLKTLERELLCEIDTVTFNISGMYGDLQGLVPSLPSIGRLELCPAEEELVN